MFDIIYSTLIEFINLVPAVIIICMIFYALKWLIK